jgi:hypothetical protein
MRIRAVSACPAAVVAALIVAALAAAPDAHAARGMEVGIQEDGAFLGHWFDRDKTFVLAHRLSVTRVRVMVQWSKVLGAQATLRRAPRVPRWDFAQFDGLLDAADANGMKLQVVLTGPAPAFAAGNHAVGPYKPNARQFARFVAAAARHFKGRVDRYSIWNEPNHKAWLAPVASAPRIYRALYVTGYRTIKRVDPSAQVLIGETVPYDLRGGRTATSPLRFLRAMLCVDSRYRKSRCGHVNADGYAHHPYEFTHAPSYRYPGADNVTIGVLGRLTGALDRLRRIGALRGPHGGRMPVYLTEYGYFATGKRRIGESRRGGYLAKAFAIALANPRVREMLHYGLVQPPRGNAGEFFATYLTDRAGRALGAFRGLAAYLTRQAKAGRIAASPTSPAASRRPG